MKIGISCNRFGAGGGLERYVRDLASGIARSGLAEVTVLAPRIDADHAAIARADGVRAVELPVGRLPRGLCGWLLSRSLARHRGDIDVLIACNRVRGAEIAVCGGTHRGYLSASARAPGLRDRLQISREIRHYQDAGVIVAHSHRMQSELRRFYDLGAKPVVTIHPPVDTDRFGVVDADMRARLRERFDFGDRPVFLFASTGHRRKGLDPAIAAIERAGRDALLVVAGRPTGRRSPVLRELGYRDDMEDLYRAADFTLLAPEYEPFGLVGVESVLSGTPLVFANGAGCLEVIADTAVHRFHRGSTSSLDAAVSAALSSREAGQARLAAPLSQLGYAPDLATHVAAMLQLCREAMA